MEQRIHNSEHVGSVLTAALRAIKAQKASKRVATTLAAPQHVVKRDMNRIPLRVAFKRRKMLARGSGVYEEEKTGDIWYREGDDLVRQATDVNGIVEKYLESCQGS